LKNVLIDKDTFTELFCAFFWLLPKPFQKHQWQKPWHLEDFANEIAIQPLPVPMSESLNL
jgi:hypothetical protein